MKARNAAGLHIYESYVMQFKWLSGVLTFRTLAAALGTAFAALAIEVGWVAMYTMKECPGPVMGLIDGFFLSPLVIAQTWWLVALPIASFVFGAIAYPRIRRYALWILLAVSVGLVAVGIWVLATPFRKCHAIYEPFSSQSLAPQLFVVNLSNSTEGVDF
jgi:hypothetical protein